jgi:hypothetical protein
VEALYPHLVYV